MALSSQGKKLLDDIFSASLKSPNGLDAARFRADNEQFIPELDQLESIGYLQRTNNMYSLGLLTLSHLAKQNSEAQELLRKCDVIFAALKSSYKDNLVKMVPIPEIARKTMLSEDDIGMALKFMVQTQISLGYASNAANKIESVSPSETILRYKSFEEVVREQEEWEKRRDQNREAEKLIHTSPENSVEQEPSLSATSSRTNWKAIEDQFGMSKNLFGRKINFVSDDFQRSIIFRDVEHSFVLANLGFSKPAVILAGSVIEEMLRLYLAHKQIKPLKVDFDGYIQTCEKHRLLKDSVSRLSDSVRQFRNLVHLSAEKTKKHTISKATAIGAVSSIFTIANDF